MKNPVIWTCSNERIDTHLTDIVFPHIASPQTFSLSDSPKKSQMSTCENLLTFERGVGMAKSIQEVVGPGAFSGAACAKLIELPPYQAGPLQALAFPHRLGVYSSAYSVGGNFDRAIFLAMAKPNLRSAVAPSSTTRKGGYRTSVTIFSG
jgi:hypothetical protein